MSWAVTLSHMTYSRSSARFLMLTSGSCRLFWMSSWCLRMSGSVPLTWASLVMVSRPR